MLQRIRAIALAVFEIAVLQRADKLRADQFVSSVVHGVLNEPMLGDEISRQVALLVKSKGMGGFTADKAEALCKATWLRLQREFWAAAEGCEDLSKLSDVSTLEIIHSHYSDSRLDEAIYVIVQMVLVRRRA